MPAALLVALALALPLAHGATPRTETKPYVTGEGELYAPAGVWPRGPPAPVDLGPYPGPACPNAPADVGGVCFALDGSESSADVRLQDAVGSTRVAADLQVLNATGGVLASLAFCDHTNPPFPLPHGGTVLAVYLYDAAYGQLLCARTTPTVGNVTVTFC
jgi:hypothetical protein